MDRLSNWPKTKQQGRRLLLTALSAGLASLGCNAAPDITEHQIGAICIGILTDRSSPSWPIVRSLPVSDELSGAEDNPNQSLFIVNGSIQERLTFERGSNDLYPSISADKKKIAYVKWGRTIGHGVHDTEFTNQDGIYTINIDGSSNSRIMNTPDADTKDSHSVISPDGNQVAFLRASRARQLSTLFRIDADGQNLTSLMEVTSGTPIPKYKFSPDGSKIAVNHDNSTFVLDKDGKTNTQIPNNAEGTDLIQDEDFFWLPNSKHLIIQRSFNSQPTLSRYFLVHSSGSQIREITNVCPIGRS
jgi:Tol biopolymer transport system component